MERIKCLVIGLDAMVPNLTARFINEGILPNLKRISKKGIFTRLRPVIPAQTPSNWNTIATGATPGTHSVVVWGSHRENEPVNEIHGSDAFNSSLCEAEYIWETLARNNERSIILNYPGYPPQNKNAIFIDTPFTPAHSLFDIAEPTVYHNIPEIETKDPIKISKAEGWKNLPSSKMPHLQAEIPIIPTDEETQPINYYALIYSRSSEYDTIALCKNKDYKNSIAELRKGRWSEWIEEKFESKNGVKKGVFRFNLLDLSPDGKTIKIYRSDVFPSDWQYLYRQKSR